MLDALGELGEFKKALQEIDAGLEIAQSQGLTREEEVLYTTKKKVLSSMGNTEGVVGINEILLQMNQKKVTAQPRPLINMELREQLRSRQEALEKIQQERRQFIVLGLVAGVISILVIFTVRTQFITAEQQKQLAEQSKLVAELELKSTERELRYVSNASIMEKNEMIETIKKDINYASQYLSDSDSKYLLNPLAHQA